MGSLWESITYPKDAASLCTTDLRSKGCKVAIHPTLRMIWTQLDSNLGQTLACRRLWNFEVFQVTPFWARGFWPQTVSKDTFGPCPFVPIIYLRQIHIWATLVWDNLTFGPQKFGPCSFGPQKFGPQNIWGTHIWATEHLGHHFLKVQFFINFP